MTRIQRLKKIIEDRPAAEAARRNDRRLAVRRLLRQRLLMARYFDGKAVRS
jgi:hypothetical protein